MRERRERMEEAERRADQDVARSLWALCRDARRGRDEGRRNAEGQQDGMLRYENRETVLEIYLPE